MTNKERIERLKEIDPRKIVMAFNRDEINKAGDFFYEARGHWNWIIQQLEALEGVREYCEGGVQWFYNIDTSDKADLARKSELKMILFIINKVDKNE